MNDYGYFAGGKPTNDEEVDKIELPDLSFGCVDHSKTFIDPQKSYSHYCEYQLPNSAYGAAISFAEEDDSGLWVSNGEYASQVNYCPFCGYKAKIQVELKND